jgi:hypothetical protein
MSRKRAGFGVRVCALAFSTVVLVSALAAGSALALPEGRVYEMVSPVYKGGYGIHTVQAVAPNGESVAFQSLGAFAGDPTNPTIDNAYVAHRGSAEWSTAPLQVPAAVAAKGYVTDYSAALESSLSFAQLGPNTYTASVEGTEDEFLLHASDAPDSAPNPPEAAPNFEVAGNDVLQRLAKKNFSASELSSSPDLSHIVFDVDGGEALLPEALETDASVMYDLTSHPLSGEQPLRVVELTNKRKVLEPECSIALGAGSGKDSSFNAVAADGGEIFFSTTTFASTSECHEQIFVRLDGSRTLEVSRPISSKCAEVPCGVEAETRAQAQFQGANEAGTKVFFTTAQPLIAGDTDASNNLYMATIGCPSSEPKCEVARREVTALAQVSHDPNVGEGAEVQDVVALAQDGSRVYFVARGALSTGVNVEGHSPVKGADNLYVYDSVSGGSPVFIGDLCSGPEESGVAEDGRCPTNLNDVEGSEGSKNDTSLWDTDESEAQVNGCSGVNPECEAGRFLLFSAYAQLSANDKDDAKDLYRYDAETGALERVSVGEGGYDANGNRNDGDEPSRELFGEEGGTEAISDATIARNHEYGKVYEQQDMGTRAISEDGSQVVFTTTEPLSPDAVNDLANVYEWHVAPGGGEGEVSLISTGDSSEPVTDVVISDTGHDIFFDTAEGLVPQDTDGQSDVYDARIDGGFPAVPAPEAECSGDACQGPLTNPAPLLVPGSVSQAPIGTPAPTKITTTVKKALSKKCSKPKKLSHGQCVKAKAKTKKKAKAKQSSHSNRRGRS